MNRLSIPRLTGLSLIGLSVSLAFAGVPEKVKPARNIRWDERRRHHHDPVGERRR